MEEIKNINKEKYHLSYYNIFSQVENKNLIACVNLLKKTYSEILPDNLLKLYDLSKNNFNFEDEFIQKAISQGIIVDYDEREFLKSLFLTSNNSNSIGITIAPTLACNFNCPYCFEDHTDKTIMNLEIQDKLINFIKEIINYTNKKRLHVTWFGGEPLLCIDIIKYISESIINFCNEKKIFYNASIITNGYLFNKENVEILNKYKVTFAQITLDGTEKNHNLTRHLTNGNGSYQQIIDNLNSVEFKGHISIRNNIYNRNKEDVPEIKKIINEINKTTKNNISYSPAPVVNFSKKQEKNEQMDILNIRDSIKVELQKNNNNFPKLRTNYCLSSSLFSFCVDNKGNLYKCWDDIGIKDRSYGNIESWNINNPFKTADNLNILTKYLNSPGILNEECYNCVWLPICAGGCSSKKFFQNIKCVPYKYDIDFFIQKIKEILEKNKAK